MAIEFKESKILNILGFGFLIVGLLIIYSTYKYSEGLVMGFVSMLLGLNFFHMSELDSIKKYLNQTRRENGIK